MSGDPAYLKRQARIRRLRRRRLRTALVASVIVVLIVVLALHSGGGSGGRGGNHASATALKRAVPPITVSMTADKTTPVGGSPPAIPWTETGQSAVAVPSAGLLETSGPESPEPIASLTKMMTAYLTLEEHPLTATSSGPSLTMTSLDQQYYDQAVDDGASSVEVQTGEVLTERQLLSALIVRSACNLANTLAVWDAGSVPAFVAQMNAEAVALGMSETHYADASGLDSNSVSTAHDQLLLVERALQLPSFASIVNQTSVTLPYTGTLGNYVTQVGYDGVVGVKSGFTDAAEACVVLAAVRQVGDEQVIVLAADLGQSEGLDYAGEEDLDMIDAISPGLRVVTMAGAHQVVGKLSNAPPGHKGGSTAPLETAAPLQAVAWPDTNVTLQLKAGKIRHRVAAGSQVGFLEATSAGGTPVLVPLVSGASLKP